MGVNERSLKMMENFMSHHEAGLTIKEIAELYDLNVGTVYAHLGEIADREGVTRASLLKVVHAPHIFVMSPDRSVEKIDTEKFDKRVATVRAEIGEIQQHIRQTIERMEKYQKEVAAYEQQRCCNEV